MRASIPALRIALRAADAASLDRAVSMLVYYIEHNQPLADALAQLLAPIEGDEAFNQRLDLVRAEIKL